MVKGDCRRIKEAAASLGIKYQTAASILKKHEMTGQLTFKKTLNQNKSEQKTILR